MYKLDYKMKVASLLLYYLHQIRTIEISEEKLQNWNKKKKNNSTLYNDNRSKTLISVSTIRRRGAVEQRGLRSLENLFLGA